MINLNFSSSCCGLFDMFDDSAGELEEEQPENENQNEQETATDKPPDDKPREAEGRANNGETLNDQPQNQEFPKISQYDREYFEKCANFLINSNNPEKIPLHVKVYGIIRYPFLLPYIYDEHKDRKKEILTELENIFGDNACTQFLFKYITNAEKYENENREAAKNSAFFLFNYLYGFTFEKIHIKELDKKENYILLNAAYNLEKLDSIIHYKEIPRMRIKFLNENEIEIYKPYEKTPIKPAKEPFTIIENNKSEFYKVGINYNNGFFTICAETVKRKEFLSGKYYGKPFKNFLKLKYDLAQIIEDEKEDEEEFKSFLNTISAKISEIFDDCAEKFNAESSTNSGGVIKMTIEKIKTEIKEFAKECEKNKIPFFNLRDFGYFVIYLDYVKELEIWNKLNVLEYVKAYFVK